jgi:hypothetical protein
MTAAASASPAQPRTDWPAVLAAVLCGVAVAMNVGKVPIAMSELRTEFGLSLVAAGWVSSMLTAGRAVGHGRGPDSRPRGCVRMVIAGLLLGAIGSVGALAARASWAWPAV